MEVKEFDSSNMQSTPFPVKLTSFLVRILWTVLISVGSVAAHDQGNTAAQIAYIAAAVSYIFVVHPLSWRAGDTIRRFTMPEFIVASNATEIFKKKIFWYVGPQWFATLFAFAVIIFAIEISLGPVVFSAEFEKKFFD